LVSWSPPRFIRRVVPGPGVLTELTLRRYHRYGSAARARLAGSQSSGTGSPPQVAEPLAMAAQYAGRGFCALQSATSCRLICGKGLLARRGCGVPRMTGAMQCTKRPSLALARPAQIPPARKPLISAQAPWRGAACTETAAPKPTINVPRMPPQNFTPGVRFQRLAQKVPPRDASLRLRRGRARPI
jgi:hypothetical protein